MLLEGRSRNINARQQSRSALIFVDSPVRKSYLDSNIIYRMRMQGYCDVYKWTILKRTSPEVKCLSQIFTRRRFLHAQWEKR